MDQLYIVMSYTPLSLRTLQNKRVKISYTDMTLKANTVEIKM